MTRKGQPMACNIDSKGKAVRLLIGGLTVIAAVLLTVLAFAGVLPTFPWVIVAVAAALGGAFAVYEGWAGWCAVRAMGFKTPI
ncbi:MAG: hypothetical protein AAGI54_12380 [Planctomycetota bacterium]